MRLAAIDVGTNTALMLVADYLPGQTPRLQAVADFLEMPRLGQDLDRTGRLHPEAIARTLAALRRQLERAKEHGVAQVLIVGTESMRAAANSAELLTQIAELGVPLRIISGDEEARLSFRSVVESLPKPSAGALSVLDIGGGSTELVVGGKDSGWKPFKWQSVKVGSVRMHERHLHSDPPTPSEQAALRTTIRAAIKDLPQARGPLVALAGTATTLGALHLGLKEHDSKRLDGLKLPVAALTQLLARLSTLTVAQRCELPGLDMRRADVIYAGGVILEEVALQAGVDEVIISDRGVRWGVLEELADSLGRPA